MTAPPDFSDASKWRTRDGRKFRIYSTDGGTPFPIHGAVLDGFGWSMRSWTRSGLALYGNETDYDLIPIAPPRIKRTLFLNVYQRDTYAHTSEDEANKYRRVHDPVMACVRVEIDVPVGEGLQ